MNQEFLGNFSKANAREYKKKHRQNLLDFESRMLTLQDTNNQLTEELSEANKKINKLNEDMLSDIEKF